MRAPFLGDGRAVTAGLLAILFPALPLLAGRLLLVGNGIGRTSRVRLP